MDKLIRELQQHALIAANKVKLDSKENNGDIDKAYARAKSFNEVICPVCWVCKEEAVELIVDAYAREANVYKCSKCNFSEALSKPETFT